MTKNDGHQISRSTKRKNNEDLQDIITQTKKQHLVDNINVHHLNPSPPSLGFDLDLALSLPSSVNNSAPPTILSTTLEGSRQALELPASHPILVSQPAPTHALANPATACRGRRNSGRGNSHAGRANSKSKSPTISPPFPWATDRRATVHSMDYLQNKNIKTITGDVQCKKCERTYTIGYNLQEKFQEIARYVVEQKHAMRHRAPEMWTNPDLPKCQFCGQDSSCKPVISAKKKFINWLFLLLGQMLGCCTLEQLKYFCKHTKNHRTGAKDRVLFLAYLALCKQLAPSGPFDISS